MPPGRVLLAAALLAVSSWPHGVAGAETGQLAPDPLEPATSGGVELIDRALARLECHRRLLVVGAHPDDEDNALLTWVGRGLGGEAAYLSLSRGEGGQNLIGTELGVELGVVRTGELLAARRLEGARQYFARAFDFGYTRSLEETFARWPREVLLEDTVRVVRRFKPQVIVAVFPADERAGHGQHQASGVVAREAFAVAGDRGRFVEQERAGIDPWQPEALFQRAWSREQASAVFELGLDPWSGRSLGQLAAASRSRHRSQDMGREQRIGRYRGSVVWEAGPGGPQSSDLFAGIDTRLEGIAALLGSDPRRSDIAADLRRVETLARATRGELAATSLASAVEPIAEMIRRLDGILARLGTSSPRERVTAELVGEKRAAAARALAAAAGVVLDATVDREQAVAGEAIEVTASIWPASNVEVDKRSVRIRGELGVDGRPRPASEGGLESERGVFSWTLPFDVPPTARPTVDDYLERPRRGDLYDWSAIPEAHRGEPRAEPPLIAVFELGIAGIELELEREVVHRYGDQARGEVRRPFKVVAPVEIAVDPDLVLWRRGEDRPVEIEVVLRSRSAASVTGEVRAEAPSGWLVSGSRSFELTPEAPEREILLRLVAPADVPPGRYHLGLRAELADGSSWGGMIRWIEYPHIRPAPAPRRAAVEVAVLDLEMPALRRVGYVVGASDRVPSTLEALGLPMEILTAARLLRADLTVFDTIVVGSRAYETDPALAAANGRLLEFVRQGGTLVVQYQQYQFVRGGYAPYRLTIDRPHGRVTDETAPVRVLDPDHPVFRRPNRITAEDWKGWVQERGLYFAAEWDERYHPLLALADPGRPEERGALLVAPLGKGTYVYSGLSFFRQLPAGVPGAIRLFVNLLGLRR